MYRYTNINRKRKTQSGGGVLPYTPSSPKAAIEFSKWYEVMLDIMDKEGAESSLSQNKTKRQQEAVLEREGSPARQLAEGNISIGQFSEAISTGLLYVH
mmetsp:Transcript_9693/g.26035  ORF Transcript_9693/g.26035 Transcript_9693/m.26035 type:complete len:99 (-) Transcript_9693:28-324(-)